MQLKIPLIEWRRQQRRRRRPAKAPAPPPAGEVVVVELVTIHSLHEIDFSFSQPVTSIGGVGNEQIVITTGGEPNTPSSAEQVDATTVRFWFESVTAAGDAWAIENVPDGLDFHGLSFVVPQGGTVALD